MKIVVFIFCLFLSVNVFGQAKTGQNKKPALIVVDGVIYSPAQLNTINPNDVERVSVLKGAAATKLYGAKAAGGLLIVTLKKNRKQALNFSALEKALASTNASAKPLVVIDGAIFKGDISSVDSNNVAGIVFVQSSTATMIYGAAGANGAIDLKMKPHTSIDTTKTNK